MAPGKFRAVAAGDGAAIQSAGGTRQANIFRERFQRGRHGWAWGRLVTGLQYRADIDGLRAVAVLAVLFYHINNAWLPGGFIGVDVFFVISGYLITRIIYTDVLAGTFSFREFYRRRINRILPVLFFVCLVVFCIAWYLFLPEDFLLFLRSLSRVAYFSQNLFFAQQTGGYWDPEAETFPLLHTWSLAVEEQFYFIAPALLLVLFKCGLRTSAAVLVLILLACASFSLAQFSPNSEYLTKYNYYSLFTGRAGELLVGAVVGLLSLHGRVPGSVLSNALGIAGVAGIALSYAFISQAVPFPSYWTLVPTLSTAALIYAGAGGSLASRLLSTRAMVFIGAISYSLYLWHWPIIVFVRYLFVDELNLPWAGFVLVATFGCALFTYYCIEQPCRRIRRSFRFSLVLFYLLPAALILGVYTLNKKSDFLSPDQVDERYRLYSLQKQYYLGDGYCHNETDGECVFGDPDKAPTVLLVGDSHAGHYAPYIAEAGRRYGFSARVITADGCLPIPDPHGRVNFKGDSRCITQVTPRVAKEIEHFDNIIFAANWDMRLRIVDDLRDGQLVDFPAYLGGLRERGKNVVLLERIPRISGKEYNRWFVYFLRGWDWPGGELLLEDDAVVRGWLGQVAENGRAQLFDPLEALGEAKRSWPIYNGQMAYKDVGHLNEYVTRQWAGEVLPKQAGFWRQFAEPRGMSSE
ncbi:acyltransferase family protein [Stutzerimonas kirkiae]|uniref:acyltransferase family protein n=1 Tax=Stutzerimonas kirkiae TaxID=2211392 RepID=UPI0013F16CCB|nr:acyltransferase family protein [Stutzerimonas kirkiae]